VNDIEVTRAFEAAKEKSKKRSTLLANPIE
jgi:hypothetical protein